ncbi:GMC family oxidoreductase [Methylobacterium aerolatum]|uniref:Choline dehydrogenase-like flavoprotein n=1 Tax=Methylobacterium aerolatum TaxID=418708 RepID=A0ABU0HYD6_9HYPH|nr:GMC family oxidoreductase [Methylobacterium aerolatum]MDQ0447354.1 choline dehydrogenase-like flavoprotein [Methylobacterium aerolatum]GJD34105.1 2-methyl-1,2-propanediol dehydrogenase [Methylobacterium aerolatum]
MNLDAMNSHSEDQPVDVVVIGTGAGGAPVLARLAAAGLSVVALEAGPNFTPETFAFDETLADEIYWTDERLSGGPTPEAFGGNNSGTGVGGSMLHWGAFVPRADARDMRLRTETGEGADWPLTAEELRPYYERVEGFLGVSGPARYPWDDGRRYPLAPVPRNGPAQLMASACEAKGVRWADAPAAVVSRDFQSEHGPLRHACINCGFCHQGCRNGAKASMDVSYLPYAVHHGAEIRAESFVHGFERDGAGRITAVLYTRDGSEHRQRCRAVFLCAGAVETPRLLLHCGLANGSGQIGRNYMGHVATQVWGTFGHEVRMNRGYPSSLITEDYIRAPDADFAGGYLIQSLGVVPLTFANAVARGRGLWGQPLLDYLARYNHLAGIGINGETLPYEDNVLTLSGEVDARGMRKPKIDFGYYANEKRLNAHATRVMRGLWEAAGAEDIWVLERVAHTLGTCRMGHDGDTAVVDPFGRSFEIDNLWISDGSTFPSSLAANPALTIMALALRSAERFLEVGR